MGEGVFQERANSGCRTLAYRMENLIANARQATESVGEDGRSKAVRDAARVELKAVE